MTIIYDVIAKRHRMWDGSPSSKPNVTLFYDEDREKAIKFMNNYRKTNGYTIKENAGTFTIADLILRERLATGEMISETPYRDLFDVYGNRINEKK